jgi:DNA-binding transcriptional ArsR family regulator
MVRTIQQSAAPRPARPLVRDLTGAAPALAGAPEVILDPRPVYDFFLSLVNEPDAELLPADRTWLETSRASLSSALQRDMALTFCHDEDCKGYGTVLVDLVAVDPTVRTSADAVALVARLKAQDLLDASHEGEDAAQQAAVELGRRVLAGERELLDETLAVWPADSRSMAEPLLRDPDGYLRAIRRVVRAWHERFEPIEARIARFEQRDADARRADLARLPSSDFIERATGGVRWVPDAKIRRVLLAPTYFCRPYNYVFGGRDWHLYCYPLADGALDAERDAVPSSLVRLYRALGDESRLRILRLLADGDLYLTEIAERMGLSKPTVSHHLALLRACSLVSTTESGNMMYYSLRRDRLAGLGPDLARFLGPELGGTIAPTQGI